MLPPKNADIREGERKKIKKELSKLNKILLAPSVHRRQADGPHLQSQKGRHFRDSATPPLGRVQHDYAKVSHGHDTQGSSGTSAGLELEHRSATNSHTPVISDTVIPQILEEHITLVKGLDRVTGPKTVQLDSGSKIEADAIVFCTGYKADYSLAGRYDPTLEQPQAWTASPGYNSRALARLYRNIFSLQLPHHLAFMGAITFPSPAFQLYDLASMALTRIWAAGHQLPTVQEMTAQVDQRKWLISLASEGTVIPGWVDGAKWMAWADEAAGSDVFPHLGYGLKGWTLWLKDRQLSRVLMDGTPSPHQFRLFENGNRRAWSGAKDEILRTDMPS
ncbi:hypothetical protein J3459_008176 [Metarhizium acridum]|nr:hypothetical protein J3459_008176 [Metarhizium acridum]